MDPKNMADALDAIYDEAQKLLDMKLSEDVERRIELILALARHKHDVRGPDETKR